MPYSVVDYQKIEDHITFIRIKPNDVALTLRDVFNSLSDLSWISSFDADYIQEGFKIRAEDTIKYIHRSIITDSDTSITKDSAEYVISELARKTIVDKMLYLDIPLAELIRDKKAGNHGFDFYTTNPKKSILFGEAKYVSRDNAYGKAFKQIVKFEREKRDVSDVIILDRFCCDDSKSNVHKGVKGFIAAFSAKEITTEQLIKNIEKNTDYQSLKRFEEIICVAVNI